VLADGDHVVKRILARPRDEAKAMCRRGCAAARRAPQRRPRQHAAAIVFALRRLPAVDLAAPLGALHGLAHERRIDTAHGAARIDALELAFGDEPGLHRSPFATATV